VKLLLDTCVASHARSVLVSSRERRGLADGCRVDLDARAALRPDVDSKEEPLERVSGTKKSGPWDRWVV
jgi:hypothetical protein